RIDPDDDPRLPKRSWMHKAGWSLVAIAVIVGGKLIMDVERNQRALKKQSLIRANLPGGEWLCRKAQGQDQRESFSLNVNPGVQVVTPSGAILGAGSLDSTTRSPATSEAFYIGSSDISNDGISLKWL